MADNVDTENIKYRCSVCELCDQIESACKYCTECEEFLCKDCDKRHNVQKLTKSHTTCTINEISKEPNVHVKFCNFCQVTNLTKEALSYCNECEDNLCDDCVKIHDARTATMDHNLILLAEMDKMLKVENISCDSCSFRGIKVIAKWLCEECEENLCDLCYEAHKKAKATKHHEIMSLGSDPNYIGCDLCRDRNIKQQAILLCVECEENLCKLCSDEHQIRKITKTHILIDVNSSNKEKDVLAGSAEIPVAESLENRHQRMINDEMPGTPTAHDISTDSITIKWSKPENNDRNIVGYDIRFREVDSSTWRVISTCKPNEIETISQLKGDTVYEFKVRANYGDEDGPYSSLSSEIRTTVSLAKNVIKDSIKIEENLKKDQPMKYKIPLIESYSSRNDKAKTRKLVFGQTEQGAVQEKTIMLVGATGAGKSTLIDGMINFILDVSWEDDFRFTVIDFTEEEKAKSTDQSQSQTEWITSYKINWMKGSQIYYTLNLIDTPGFGDTRGIQRDKILVDQIREYFNTPGDQGIAILDAVCFVTQASLVRLSPTQKYIFDSILSVFGNDIVGNIFALITFADGKEPPVLESLKSAKVPLVQSFLFNNSALWEPNKNIIEASFSSMFWKLGKNSFKTFFKTLHSVEPRSLQLTSEVLRERQQIENLIQGLRPQIEIGLSKLETLRQEKMILLKHQRDIDGNKNFTYVVDKPCTTQVQLNPGTYVTNCLTCNTTCHDNCGIPDDKDKRRCLAMSDGYCSVCPKKCYWDVHKNNTFKYENYIEKVKGTYEDLKKRYEKALAGVWRKKGMVSVMKDDFRKVSMQVVHNVDKMRKSLQRVSEIALKPNPLSDVEYINILIESEKMEGKSGFQSRVNLLEQLKKDAELVQKLPEGDVKVWGDLDLDEITDPN